MRFGDDDSGEQLARRLAAGDESVLGEILRTYGQQVEGFLARRYRAVLCRGDFEDALMVAIASLWYRRSYFDLSKGSLYGWLSATANDAAVRLARSRWARTHRLECDMPTHDLRGFLANHADEGNDDLVEPTIASPGMPSLQALQTALAKLPAMQRQILLADASSREGRVPTEQLADELHVEPATIRTNRRRGLRKLRDLLGNGGVAVTHAHTHTRERERERERERAVYRRTVKRCW